MGIFPVLIFSITDSADSLKTYHLHAIRVIANQTENAISPIQHLILQAPQQTVYEALKLSPGLHLSVGSKDESNLKIRGFRKNDALILIDGRPLTAGYFGNVDLSKIILSDVKEVSIVKGAASAQFGSGSMGGVVNLITIPQSNILTLSSHMSRNLRTMQRIASAYNFGDIGYSLSVAREDKPGFVLSEDFDPTPFENGKVRDNSHYEAWHVDAKADLNIASMHELGLSWGYSHIPRKDIPSSVYARDYRRYTDYYRSFISLGGDFYSGENSRITNHIYYDAAGDTFERYRDPNYQTLDISSRMYSYNLGIAPTLQINQNFNTGFRAELRRTRRKDTGNYTEWTRNWAAVNSIFAQYQQELSENLQSSISFGLSSITHSRNSDLKLLIEPSAGIYWSLPQDTKLSLSVGQNSSMPTLRQLFSAESGNPHLRPSRAIKYELNFHKSFQTLCPLSSDSSIFFNDIHDLIDRDPELYQNFQNVRSYGFETSVGLQASRKLDIETAYSYLAFTRDSDYRLSDSAPHNVNLFLRYALPMGIDLSYEAAWRSDRDSQDDLGAFHSLKAYHVHGLQVSKAWKHVELKLNLDNILDENFQTEYGYPEAGRDYTLSISLKI